MKDEQMNPTSSRSALSAGTFGRAVFLMLALIAVSRADLTRHNEQGLSPTHSYKRNGALGVVSNLNGNLVIRLDPVKKSGAPLGVQISRAYNSHWHDPLFVQQYDMNYWTIDYGSTDPKNHYPTYDNTEPSPRDWGVSPFAHGRIYQYHNPNSFPLTWQFAAVMGADQIRAGITAMLVAGFNNSHPGVTYTQMQIDVGEKGGKNLTRDEEEAKGDYQSVQAAMQAVGIGIYFLTGGVKDAGAIADCMKGEAGANDDCIGSTLSLITSTTGSYLPGPLAYSALAYHIVKGDMTGEDMAWAAGEIGTQLLIQEAMAGTAGASAAGPVAAAAVLTIQLTRIWLASIHALDNRFDVGRIHVDPWSLGVNGYIGLLGTNHEKDAQGANSYTHFSWQTTTMNEDSSFTTTTSYQSRHPMPELRLVEADGGASRWVLEDAVPVRDQSGVLVYNYVSLSNADKRHMYYVDRSGHDSDWAVDDAKAAYDAEQADTSSGYVLKTPDGLSVEFGRGNGRKGLDVESIRDFHTYWAQVTSVKHYGGDSIAITYDENKRLSRAWETRTGRGAEIGYSNNQQIVRDGQVLPNGSFRAVDSTQYLLESQTWSAFIDRTGRTQTYSQPQIVAEIHRVSSKQVDTTVFNYDLGDLASIKYANGSFVQYNISHDEHDPMFGAVVSSLEYPDANEKRFFKETVYGYSGWKISQPQALRTTVTTTLHAPNYAWNDSSTVRRSSTTDDYVFAPMGEGVNVNRSRSGFMDHTWVTDATTKLPSQTGERALFDSLEYNTTRYQLQTEYHGTNSAGQRRIQHVYGGDVEVMKIESRGISRVFDPRIVQMDYDDDGNLVREVLHPKNIQDSIRTTLLRMSLADSVRPAPQERVVQHFVRNVRGGEFYGPPHRDTSLSMNQKVVKVSYARNDALFSLDSLYLLGLPTKSMTHRTSPIEVGGDSLWLGDSTEYDITTAVGYHGAKPVVRPTRALKLFSGTWKPVSQTEYAGKNPFLATGLRSYVDDLHYRYATTGYDSLYGIFPTSSTQYVDLDGVTAHAPLVSRKSYDLDREWVTNEVDPAGNLTHTEYDNLGRPTQVKRPDGTRTTTTYLDRLEVMPGGKDYGSGVDGWPHQKTVAVQEKDPYGVIVDARFDGSGRLVAVRKVGKGATDVSVTDTSLAHVTQLSYNLFDKLEWSRDADGREAYNDYDGTGRLTTSKVYQTPKGNNLSLSWSKSFSYLDDVSHYVETDERGVQTSFYYDKFDQDTLITRDTGFFGGAAGQIRVRHVYDNVGNLRRVIDPKGLVEDRVYDGLNRMTHVQYPDDLQRDLGYDLTGKVIQTSVQSRSQPSQSDVLTSSYDGAGRVTQESYGANARENVSYQYDAISGVAGESQSYPGQLLSIQRGTGLTSLYRYDSLQRLTRRRVVQAGLGYDVTQSYRYDASGSVVSMDLPQGRESQVPRTSYQYDVFHRLSGIAFVAGSDSLALVRNVTYRANDLLSSLGLGGHLTLSRSYEPQRPLLTNLVTKQDTTTIYRQGYAYDDVGNIIGMQRFSGDSAGYDYDKLYQLRGVRYPKGNTDNRAANLSYGYDANGNRTSFGHDFTNKDRPEWLGYQPATGTSTGSNRLQQGWSGREGYTRYGYDFRGNLSSEKSFGDSNSLVSGSNAWKEETRTFNRRNELERLFHTTRQSGADSSVWAYDYDEKGMRVEKRRTALPVTISGSDTSWSFDRKYAYDGVSAVADSSAGDTAWNYWVMMGLNRVAQVRRDGNKKWQVHYVVTDHLGTANLVTDSVGQVVQRNVLDPWGNLEMSSGTTPVAYLYTGKEWDPESGEYYFAARYYNPVRGSFTGRDAKLQFWTAYGYVGNGPLILSDRNGRDATMFYRLPDYKESYTGHIMLRVTDHESGKTLAEWSFGPREMSAKILAGQDVPGAQMPPISQYLSGKSFVSETIRLSPELDKELVGAISDRKVQNEDYNLYEENCGTTASWLLTIIGVPMKMEAITPKNVFQEFIDAKSHFLDPNLVKGGQ